MLLANGLSIFPIKGKSVFIKGSRSLPKNPLNCSISDSWDFETSILVDEPFVKALRIFEKCALVNNNFSVKNVLSTFLTLIY